MRLHTDCTTLDDVHAAAREVGITFQDGLPTEHRSTIRNRGIEVQLLGNSRHRPNNRRDNGDEFAASWDEWGMFMARIYAVDPLAVWGRASSPAYTYWEHFHWATGNRFLTLTPSEQHPQHNWDYAWSDHVSTEFHCKGSKKFGPCDAIMRRTLYGVDNETAMREIGLMTVGGGR